MSTEPELSPIVDSIQRPHPSVAAASELAPELVALILKELENDGTTLQACGLVNRIWAQCAQETLFSSITIDLPSSARKLLKVLEARPDLARKIQSVAIQISWGKRNRYAEGFSWVPVVDKELIAICAYLVQVRKVSIGTADEVFVDWKSEFSSSLRAELWDLMGRAREVELVSITNMQVQPLVGLANLENLILCRVIEDPAEAAALFPLNKVEWVSEEERKRGRRLKTLVIRWTTSFSNLLFKCLDLAQSTPPPSCVSRGMPPLVPLTLDFHPTMNVTYAPWGTREATKGINAIRQRLAQHVHSYRSTHRWLSPEELAFHCFPNLEILDIEISRHLLWKDVQKILGALEDLGKRGEGKLKLNTFIFSLAFQPLGPEAEAELEAFLLQGYTILEGMDRILCNEQAFPNLRQVIILYEDSHMDRKLDASVVKSLRVRMGDRMKGLMERDMLDVMR
ncbi:hypothetical protein CC1G_08253 [Coprinopsis cinerea okayama7|uniref:F-box domain-containing protein n=1 Tax=Coprinopsis cinerea (strain Okayama-7 / 130 / ATCC MYA-4618 / FGSC 9003) TaxID=240176 RepID=A8P7L1_COPC7|nr:hypothetical protein CC1G_08253 [Coprinopsis cinerea okayama7\|eukprot:XP_001839386.2 hypothetical protein CC1G_08253 [Coprinopsis cinerea okayama7\